MDGRDRRAALRRRGERLSRQPREARHATWGGVKPLTRGGYVSKVSTCLEAYMLNRFSRIPGTQPQCRGGERLPRQPREARHAVESRIGPKRSFELAPSELLTISKPNPNPGSEKPPARKRFSKPNI